MRIYFIGDGYRWKHWAKKGAKSYVFENFTNKLNSDFCIYYYCSVGCHFSSNHINYSSLWTYSNSLSLRIIANAIILVLVMKVGTTLF